MSENQNNDPPRVAEQQTFRHKALARLTAVALAATLSGGVISADQLHDQESRKGSVAASFEVPDMEQLQEMDRTYPTLEGADYTPRIYDEKASNESTIVYRHAGLDNLSFARPSFETNKKILDAGSLEDLEAGAAPFFETLGIKLHITTNNSDTKNKTDQLTASDLEMTRKTVLSTLNEIAITPRELIKFAHVNSLVIAKNLRLQSSMVAGVAYLKSTKPGTIAIDISGSGRLGHATTFNHEMGHHLAHQLDIKTKHAFSNTYAKLNIPGFMYRDKLPENNPERRAEHQKMLHKALAEMAIISGYSAESVSEDQAESYTSLWRGDMAPDNRDESYNTLLGSKRILWVKLLDQAFEGFSSYLGGLSTTAIYAHEKVATNHTDLAANHYGR